MKTSKAPASVSWSALKVAALACGALSSAAACSSSAAPTTPDSTSSGSAWATANHSKLATAMTEAEDEPGDPPPAPPAPTPPPPPPPAAPPSTPGALCFGFYGEAQGGVGVTGGFEGIGLYDPATGTWYGLGGPIGGLGIPGLGVEGGVLGEYQSSDGHICAIKFGGVNIGEGLMFGAGCYGPAWPLNAPPTGIYISIGVGGDVGVEAGGGFIVTCDDPFQLPPSRLPPQPPAPTPWGPIPPGTSPTFCNGKDIDGTPIPGGVPCICTPNPIPAAPGTCTCTAVNGSPGSFPPGAVLPPANGYCPPAWTAPPPLPPPAPTPVGEDESQAK